ncbi:MULTISPECIES: glycerol-3-phosphate dehydrogenase subunit GlpB [Vibrio]|uniref:glycerol-3-phosphate dehydrogenase subunit GlpB n=1 Tax=Vibrio TaxID=662 RepID=UPI0005FA723B|nr:MULTISPECIES: glycerol-3-phosphate dehydrogenase subunit GlpB [Vibrio]KJY87285.1 glycerol-3-phosphate dehydrogenase [Vibrio neptunius]MDA0118445.1 glycerol-3-phosphate dehydrogenase subunit GlpB [Vibrio sp. T11.5]NRB68070.1 glycerol-3-phosphate dehydrogenase subunit GlpB [Vibrio sp.]
MKYDVVVIGGGIAGYCSALKCLESGLKTVLINQGHSSLHFSSGSIDVLGNLPNGLEVTDPFESIPVLKALSSDHPYSKLSVSEIKKALLWFQAMLSEAGVSLSSNQNGHNHYRITPLGTIKPTWLSQPYVHQWLPNSSLKRLVLISIDGFRDFQPQLALDNLNQIEEFRQVEKKILSVRIPGFDSLRQNPNELRSIDIARTLKQPKAFSSFVHQLSAGATADDLVILPAIMGNGDGLALMERLQSETQLCFHEVPTMPPSLLGIRLEEALQGMFTKMGGIQLKGDKVVSAHWHQDKKAIRSIQTANLEDFPLIAKHYVLASGSYFSHGLIAESNQIIEPIFNLDVHYHQDRRQWRDKDFFSQSSHPFMQYGVITDRDFNPTLNSQTVRNLHCCGSVLAHYDPIQQGCGGGVAIASAFHVANNIIHAIALEEALV